MQMKNGKAYAQCGNCGEYAVEYSQFRALGRRVQGVDCHACGKWAGYTTEEIVKSPCARFLGVVEAARNLKYANLWG